jgi:putative transposase
MGLLKEIFSLKPMPRANRHYIPGYIWHITHRCHKREFLLKFAKDRRRWMAWLFEARKRYGLSILNYMVTSNHIHLLVSGNSDREVIPKSMQLLAGKTGQEYNQRKKRKGAFWEDRYHATAVESDGHLSQCMVYIDMNMVRAGVVKKPEEWSFCGYNEIQHPPKRYSLVDTAKVISLLQLRDLKELQDSRKNWIEEALESKSHSRESKWTESIGVGSKGFIEATKEKLGIRAKGRKVFRNDGAYELREPTTPYKALFDTKNDILRLENTYFWKNYL